MRVGDFPLLIPMTLLLVNNNLYQEMFNFLFTISDRFVTIFKVLFEHILYDIPLWQNCHMSVVERREST